MAVPYVKRKRRQKTISLLDRCIIFTIRLSRRDARFEDGGKGAGGRVPDHDGFGERRDPSGHAEKDP